VAGVTALGRYASRWVEMIFPRPPASLVLSVVLVAACVPPPANRPSPTPPGPTPVATPTPTPTPAGPTPTPSFIRPTPTPLPTFLSYTVKAGDSLEGIADAHQTTGRSIAFWSRGLHPSLNPDSPDYRPNHIEVGWVLLLIPNTEVDPEDFG
jgi:LysM domain-containing protein